MKYVRMYTTDPLRRHFNPTVGDLFGEYPTPISDAIDRRIDAAIPVVKRIVTPVRKLFLNTARRVLRPFTPEPAVETKSSRYVSSGQDAQGQDTFFFEPGELKRMVVTPTPFQRFIFRDDLEGLPRNYPMFDDPTYEVGRWTVNS